jgi:TPR repeat protein
MPMSLRKAMDLTKKENAGKVTKEDGASAVASLREAAERDKNAEAMLRLALIFERGEIVSRDLAMMVKYTSMGCDAGDDYCMLKMGHCYATGNGVKADVAEGLRWYKKAAAKGNETAAFRVNDIGTLIDTLTRLGYDTIPDVLRDAEKGNPDAMYLASKLFASGCGCPMDKDKSSVYQANAAASGAEEALDFIFSCEMDDATATQIVERWKDDVPSQQYLRHLTVFLAGHMSKRIDAKDADGMNLMAASAVRCIQCLADSGDLMAQKVMEHWDQSDGDDAPVIESIEALGKMYLLMLIGDKTTVRE